MVQNSKNITAMRKFITSILIAAAAMTACVQNDDFVVNNTNDTITLTAHITAPEARTVLVDDGDDVYHAEWAVGDEVRIYEVLSPGAGDNPRKKNEDNENTIKLTEGGKTIVLSTTLKVVDNATKFYYVFGTDGTTMNTIATTIAYTIPASQAPLTMDALDPKADALVSQIVEMDAQPTTPITFTTTRLSSIAKVTIKVPTALAADDAVTGVIFTCENDIAGKYSMKWESVAAGTHFTNATDNATDKTISVTLPEAQTEDFSFYMGLWPTTLAQGSEVTVSVMTEKGKEFIKTVTLPSAMEFAQGDMTGFTVNMSATPEYIEQTYEPIEGTVNVAGIYWALGNLEYTKDGNSTTDDFVKDWRIAPTQYHHFNMETTDASVTNTTYVNVAHFNFGGIGTDESGVCRGFAPNANYVVNTTASFEFSGKMYTDQTCTTVTTNYADAKFGDIAFWASKGKYRMPTDAEFDKLYKDACYIAATYTEGANTISGKYFYNPGVGEIAGEKEGTKTLTDDDLTTGLFLPYSGRGYNNNNLKIYKVNTQCVYRTSTVAEDVSTSEMGYGVIYTANNNKRNADTTTIKTVDDGTKSAKTLSYGATSRYAIRPIYIVAE